MHHVMYKNQFALPDVNKPASLVAREPARQFSTCVHHRLNTSPWTPVVYN